MIATLYLLSRSLRLSLLRKSIKQNMTLNTLKTSDILEVVLPRNCGGWKTPPTASTSTCSPIHLAALYVFHHLQQGIYDSWHIMHHSWCSCLLTFISCLQETSPYHSKWRFGSRVRACHWGDFVSTSKPHVPMFLYSSWNALTFQMTDQ